MIFDPTDFDSLVDEAKHHIPSMASALANKKMSAIVREERAKAFDLVCDAMLTWDECREKAAAIRRGE